jgi:hypothetical protein
MFSKQEIEQTKSEINQLQQTIYSTQNIQKRKIQELLSKVLSCEEILNQSPWNLQTPNILFSTTNRHSLLADYLQSDYHCSFENETVNLCFSDSDIYLHFNNKNSLTQLIEKYHIKLETNHLLRQVKNLQKAIQTNQEELNTINKEINKIQNLNKELNWEPTKEEIEQFKKILDNQITEMSLEQIPCHICNTQTTMLGTKLCDRCWELESRIIANPELAKKIIASLENKNKGHRTLNHEKK